MPLVPVLVSVIALVAAVAALGMVLWDRRPKHLSDPADLPEDVPSLRSEVAGLRLDLETTMRHLAVVRYDAVDDLGGHLSWSVAMVDDHGSGMVLTSIHSRQNTRSYAKPVSAWKSEQPLSPEEEAAVGHARADRL